MHNTINIKDDLIWLGGSDRRITIFEGAYPVSDGMSYNAYLLKDEKRVLIDTVDKELAGVFFENLEYALGDDTLDYVIVQHVEPDHSATLKELTVRYPDVKIICSKQAVNMIRQFYGIEHETQVVKEGDVFSSGRHELTFVNAPMVHWPEVIMTYDKTDKILFSADAFGSFGAHNGAISDDAPNFSFDAYLPEARRYYANIVGKYGSQVSAVLNKASALEIECICPLHGVIWKSHIRDIVAIYGKWAAYEPEKDGVVIFYGSIYGNSANSADILAGRLASKGVGVRVMDMSMKHPSDALAAVFEYSRIVIISSTVDAGIFSRISYMLDSFLAHNICRRKVAIIDNGTWAPMAGKLIREKLATLKDLTILDESFSIKSSLTPEQAEVEMERLAEALL